MTHVTSKPISQLHLGAVSSISIYRYKYRTISVLFFSLSVCLIFLLYVVLFLPRLSPSVMPIFVLTFTFTISQVHPTSECVADEGRRSLGNHGYHTRAAMEETSRQSAEAADEDDSTSEVDNNITLLCLLKISRVKEILISIYLSRPTIKKDIVYKIIF